MLDQLKKHHHLAASQEPVLEQVKTVVKSMAIASLKYTSTQQSRSDSFQRHQAATQPANDPRTLRFFLIEPPISKYAREKLTLLLRAIHCIVVNRLRPRSCVTLFRTRILRYLTPS